MFSSFSIWIIFISIKLLHFPNNISGKYLQCVVKSKTVRTVVTVVEIYGDSTTADEGDVTATVGWSSGHPMALCGVRSPGASGGLPTPPRRHTTSFSPVSRPSDTAWITRVTRECTFIVCRVFGFTLVVPHLRAICCQCVKNFIRPSKVKKIECSFSMIKH